MVPNFDRLIGALLHERAELVLVGGLALVIHGSGRTTRIIDISYGRSADNLRAIVRALAPFRPRLRGAPEGLPFLWNEKTLKSAGRIKDLLDLDDIEVIRRRREGR